MTEEIAKNADRLLETSINLRIKKPSFIYAYNRLCDYEQVSIYVNVILLTLKTKCNILLVKVTLHKEKLENHFAKLTLLRPVILNVKLMRPRSLV